MTALKSEIELYKRNPFISNNFDTIYIGGGTPSILSGEELLLILDKLHDTFSFSSDTEITLELNPGTLTDKKLAWLFSVGINRLSIGVQSFSDTELRILERGHTVREAEKSISEARDAGFKEINIDLIYALPDQNLSSWEKSLNKTLEFKPEHISAYNLTLEEGTPFYTRLSKGELNVHDQENEAAFFSMTHDFLCNHGYQHYEVSNFAQSDAYISRHNYKYWMQLPYLAFGPSAHSYWSGKRWNNLNTLPEYISLLLDQKLPIENSERISYPKKLFEHIFLRLRTYQGINLSEFQKKFRKSFFTLFSDITETLINNKYALIENNYFKLTHKGMLVCDEIVLYFVPDK